MATVSGPHLTGDAQLGKAQRVDVVEGEVTASIPFERPVDEEWIRIFRDDRFADFPNDLEDPRVVGNTAISFWVAKDDLKRYVQALKARVKQANEAFAAEIVPKRERQVTEAKARQTEKEREEKEVRTVLNRLLP